VQHVERVRGGRLVVLVVGDQTTTEVAGQHLGRREMPRRERRLARAGRADQHDQRHVRKWPVRSCHFPGELGQLGGRSDLGVVVADGQVADLVAVTRGHGVRPVGELRACPFESVVGMPKVAAGRVAKRTLCSAFGVVTTTVVGAAAPNTERSRARSRLGSMCSITSISTAAS